MNNQDNIFFNGANQTDFEKEVLLSEKPIAIELKNKQTKFFQTMAGKFVLIGMIVVAFFLLLLAVFSLLAKDSQKVIEPLPIIEEQPFSLNLSSWQEELLNLELSIENSNPQNNLYPFPELKQEIVIDGR